MQEFKEGNETINPPAPPKKVTTADRIEKMIRPAVIVVRNNRDLTIFVVALVIGFVMGKM